MNSKKNRISSITSIILIFTMIVSMFSFSSLQYSYAETKTDLDITDVQFTGDLLKHYELKLEKQEDGENDYNLWVPDALIGKNNAGKIHITLPDHTEDVKVTYKAFGLSDYTVDDAKDKEVVFKNGENTITLEDYYNYLAYGTTQKSAYTPYLKLQIGTDKTYNIEIKGYSDCESIGVGRPRKEEPDGSVYTTAVLNKECTIRVRGHFPDDNVIKINGVEGEELKYTPTKPGLDTISVEISNKNDARFETRTYNLKVDVIEKDYYPVIKNNVPSTINCNQYDPLEVTFDVENIDENTNVTWYHGKMNKLQPIDLKGNTIKIDTTKVVHQLQNIYKYEVSNIVNGLEYEVTKQFKINVKAKKLSMPVIVKQPVSSEYTAGEKALPIVAEYDRILGGHTDYQWYKNTTDDNKTGTPIEGATSAEFIPPTNQDGTTYYYCTIVEQYQNLTSPKATSNCACIKVNPLDINLTGKGTSENPYNINTLDDLNELSKFVDKGYTFAGSYFKMQKDITLPLDWDPIGSTKDGSGDSNNGINLRPFSGIFDGNNKTINIVKGGLPLFDYVREAEVKNLNIYGPEINGYGLVNKYVVDYGADGNYNTGVPEVIDIDNVTLKKGSATKASGFIGGYGSGQNIVEIRNSTVEDGVVIGYDKKGHGIGSFAGLLNGTIVNCKSAATVYGTDGVGGIAGIKGQSMGPCSIMNSSFTGEIVATGNKVGGIIGSGYSSITAPNTPLVYIINCYVKGNITGADYVGGILGAETGCEESWGIGGVGNTAFYGKINATGENVGATVGYLRSIDKHQFYVDNFAFNDCGAKKSIGHIEKLIYESESPENGMVEGSFNEAECGKLLSPEEFKSEATLNALNTGKYSMKNWTKDEAGYPVLSETPVAYKLDLSGDYKTEYYTGSELDTSKLVVTATYTDGNKKTIAVDDPELKITGFDSDTIGIKTIKLSYGSATAEYNVRVVYEQPGIINVAFKMYGDTKHDANKGTHTLFDHNLDTWIEKETIKINSNATVADLINDVLKKNNMSCKNPTGNYIESVTKGDITLAEFTNGPKSGWMYTLNGVYPNLGVGEQYLADGDEIVFHYTDDFTKEKAQTEGYEFEAKEIDNLISAIGKVTLEKEAQIERVRAAYEGLPGEAQKLVTKLSVLEDAEKALAELKKPVKPVDPVKPEDKTKEYKKAYNEVGSFYADNLLGFGDEWAVIGLTRGGYPIDKAVYDRYYQSVLQKVKSVKGELHRSKYTEYSRTILALTAAGYDPTDVGGYNLVAKLGDFNKVKAQGPNGSIWALIALDSNKYELSKDSTTTREKLIAEILANEISGGGWSMDPFKADVDMTGMAIQALAPYYKTNADVKAAVDRGLAWLSSKMTSNGAFREFGGKESLESTAQVVVALTALGIDPVKDDRFVKSGKNALDGLMMFFVGNGRFEHLKDTGANGIATEQGFYALASYLRFAAGKTALYDMTDLTKAENPKETETVLPIVGPNGNATVVTDKTSINIAPSEIKNLTNELTVKLADKTVKYDKKAMDAIKKQIPADAKNVEIVLEKVEKGYNNKQAETIKESKALGVFSVKLIVTRADGTMFEIHDFNGGKATITVPFANPKNLKLEVHRVEADGSLKLMNSTYKNGMISWVTDGHSYYMVTEEGTAKAATEKTTPKTGDTNNMIPWSVLLLGAAGAVTLIRRKKNSNYN